MMNLTIDSNEYTNKKLRKTLENKGLFLVPETLAVGDFFIPPKDIIERKEYSDFISSSKNRGGLRIFEQLQRMKDLENDGYRVTLLIEGDEGKAVMKKTNRTGLSFKAAFNQMQGLKIAIAVDFGIPIITSPSMDVTGYILKRMVEKSSDDGTKPIPLRSSVPVSRPMKEKIRYILEGFPFIGPRTADNIIETYGSLRVFFWECINEPASVSKNVRRMNKKIPYEIKDILVSEG